MRRSTKVVMAVLGLTLVGGVIVLVAVVRRGISCRAKPTAIEETIALRIRHLAIPSGARNLTNPVSSGPEALAEGKAHFADHCASCHGNDGKGQTEMGRNMYPKVPDMTLPRSQLLSDGELFYIIKNGVRFTGMPAWGADTPEADRESWKLVHFIRHFPAISPSELEEMKVMNPVSPADLKEEQEINAFLESGDEPDSSSPKPKPKHQH